MPETLRKTMLLVKVVPSSSRNCIVGWLGETLKVRVQVPAERGRVNEAVEKILSRALGAPARIVSGSTSPRKTIEISSISRENMRHRFPKTDL